MTHKNNSLWRFLFSLIPGAGEMYMGFFKAGTSLMSLFFFFIFAAASIGFGELLIIDVIVWFGEICFAITFTSLPSSIFFHWKMFWKKGGIFQMAATRRLPEF